MSRILFPAILGALLFASCLSNTGKQILTPPETAGTGETQKYFIVTDHKNKLYGEPIPEWVNLYLEGGASHVETLDAYGESYVFIGRNEGNNFNALTQWTKGFSPELDFPRLAAARIETRFRAAVPYPDEEYGAFFEELIRTASDTVWTGAVREDDFWIRKTYFPGGASEPVFFENEERETWEFLILVTIDRKLFASQLATVFRNTKPNPAPAKDQIAAANRVKDRFFTGF